MNGNTSQLVNFHARPYVKFATVVGVLFLLNYLSLQYDVEFDLTETGEFSLSPETLQVLDNLTEPVHVVGFFKKGDYRWAKAAKYLERYSYHNNLFTYALHDPNIETTLAESYQVKSYGLVFINDVHRYVTYHIDEESITIGVLSVISSSPNDKNLRFVSIDEKETINRKLFLNPLQIALTFVVTVIVFPTLVLFGGIRVWRARH